MHHDCVVILMEDDVFKPSPGWEKEIEKEARRVIEGLKKNPVLLGVLMAKLIEEKENTNRLLKTLINRIERLEKKIEKNETSQKKPLILSEIDQKILEFINRKGTVTAEDVMKEFGYKGQNGASARLNKLYSLGFINKTQAGKKVYFYTDKATP